MDHDFWHERWASGRLGFHEPKPNPLLVSHFPALSVPMGGRVFLPLCGKTLDIDWLLANGHRVAGAELSEIAVWELFERLDVEPGIVKSGDLDHYHAPGIDIFAGDIFNLSRDALGPIDAVYDRAAYVALPEEMRRAYAAHVTRLTTGARHLLVTFEYDQSIAQGPPFSISRDELKRNYGPSHSLNELSTNPVAGGMKGVSATETVWLLDPKNRAET